MPRRTSTNSSDKDNSSEEGNPTLPILTRAQHQRFIEEQQRIIRKLIGDSYPDRIVHYTIFDTPKIVHDDALEDILRVQHIIYEIIFDQRSRNIFVFYSRDLPGQQQQLAYTYREEKEGQEQGYTSGRGRQGGTT